jgi:hypothetical protein
VRAWRLALCLAALIVASVLGCTVILWSDSNLQLTDVNVVSRLVGPWLLTAVAITPLALLQRAWDAGDGSSREVAVRRAPVWQAAVAWGLVVAAAIAYPATLLAGRSTVPERLRLRPRPVGKWERAGGVRSCGLVRRCTPARSRAVALRIQSDPARPGRLRQDPRVRRRCI